MKIYLDRIKNGESATLEENLDPKSLDINEEEMQFQNPIKVKVTATKTEDEVLFTTSIEGVVELPCIICEKKCCQEVKVKEAHELIPLAEIKSHVYDMSNLVRELILLQVPAFVECSGGTCPDRKEVDRYFKKDRSDEHLGETTRPFENL